MSTKIGVGIITCDRPNYLKGLLKSLDGANIDCLYIINDGKPLKEHNVNIELSEKVRLHEQTPQRQGVAKAKNQAMRYLLNENCDYIFVIEEDMLILNKDIFNKYIEAYKLSGIHHFNYGPGSPFNRKQDIQFDLHNRHLLKQDSQVNPKLIIEYSKDIKVALYEHTVAMFSFFTKEVLEKVGLIDEQFYNAWEHVDHTYRIIKAGYHPPFWWFADLADSHNLLTEAPNAITDSSIAKDTKQWEKNVFGGREVYKRKHGHYPNEVLTPSKQDVIEILKKISKRKNNL
jgi:GT2 family glycosyltransferase